MDNNKSAIDYAAEELNKYTKILGITADISLGLFEDFKVSVKLEDPFFDDAFKIFVKDKKGYIAGSNGRSVLFGVYRLLEEWGVVFVRPGKNGTRFPNKVTPVNLDICEVAAKRHRTMCIEGAVSIENLLDTIEWLPKMGFNSYYIQFEDAYVFFERWYSHEENPIKEKEYFDQSLCDKYIGQVIKEIKKRGLLLHRMGHGWTCAPFGLPNRGWEAFKDEDIPQSYKDISAMINGERKVWKNMPTATQLCYSNPKVYNTIVNAVVDYAEKNPETDVIHFWLGDYFRNICECDECTKLNYSDYYVRMINAITEKLSEKGLKKKIAFEIGYDLCWTPKETEILRKEDLMLTFAPISRTFGASFPNEYKIKEMPEYAVNKCPLPRDVDENLASLYFWKKRFSGDVVDFDYHLMWDYVIDGGAEGIARVIYDDIKNFEKLGINSFISCQIQRNFFPTSLAMTIMGKTLWNTNTDFERVKHALYGATFGEEYADFFCEYFGTLSKGFNIGAVRSQVKVDKKEYKKAVEKAISALENVKTTLKNRAESTDNCINESFRYLEVHREIYLLLAEGILCKLMGKAEEGNQKIAESVALAWKREDEVQPVFDAMFYNMIPGRVNLEGQTEFFDF